ncbi:MAG TPA: ATPase domain-containing protein, partial [Pyrinomonadaceae bacterium]|nr:ATPase domain-containing protein [Pyrinomonadaceae bacterium]
MLKPQVLRFGIQSFDRLIGKVKPESDEEPVYGIDISDPDDSDQAQQNGQPKGLPITSSICLAGPDGTGKSILSLHLASRYLTDCLLDCIKRTQPARCPNPRVLYISTDLTYKMALKGWRDFGLDKQLVRRDPLLELKKGRKAPPEKQLVINLEPYTPSAPGRSTKSIVDYLENYAPASGANLKAEVCFVDLASSTAGDDWGFVHRLLSALDEPDQMDPRHLVILDAVEGFETLVGDLNAFGEKSSRRSRIAQVMRLAAAKCHLLLVVEEGHQQRFPEEFVTDVVIRLRNVNTGRYVRRTIEVEKARGQSHRRGQHPYIIRHGEGSTTGSQTNADDPNVFLYGSNEQKHQGYVHVFPSLDFNSREIMIDRYNPPPISYKNRYAAFGLPYLDNMLDGKGDKAERSSDRESDTRGLNCGSATALIGDSLTQKSQLG